MLTALSEVENSLIACRRTTERLATLEKATAAAREAAELAQPALSRPARSTSSPCSTPSAPLLGLEDSLFTARADRTTAYIQLYKALGGGWSAGS